MWDFIFINNFDKKKGKENVAYDYQVYQQHLSTFKQRKPSSTELEKVFSMTKERADAYQLDSNIVRAFADECSADELWLLLQEATSISSGNALLSALVSQYKPESISEVETLISNANLNAGQYGGSETSQSLGEACEHLFLEWNTLSDVILAFQDIDHSFGKEFCAVASKYASNVIKQDQSNDMSMSDMKELMASMDPIIHHFYPELIEGTAYKIGSILQENNATPQDVAEILSLSKSQTLKHRVIENFCPGKKYDFDDIMLLRSHVNNAVRHSGAAMHMLLKSWRSPIDEPYEHLDQFFSSDVPLQGLRVAIFIEE